MQLTGIVKKDRRTKNLVKRLKKGDIALIYHQDFDRLAALSLIEKKVKAVLNAEKFLSGETLSQGASLLLEKNIFLIEDLGENIFNAIQDTQQINIVDNSIYLNGHKFDEGKVLTKQITAERLNKAKENLSKELDAFVENTLAFIKEEKDLLLQPPKHLPFKCEHQDVVIVVRGASYKEDLQTLKNYIQGKKPLLIGVDGGADALLEIGYKPDVILGDMDSVTQETLFCGAKLIVHAYDNGKAPGLKRVQDLNLKCEILPMKGTSEDVAMICAYYGGAELIVGVGMHFSLEEFLEKGRKGMSSTFLSRLLVGSILFDAKGVAKLYYQKLSFWDYFFIFIAASVPFIAILLASPFGRSILRLLKIIFQKNFGL